MGRTTFGIAVLVLALGAAQPARADFDAGQRAWDAGRLDEALTQWHAVADTGDRRAMLALGRLYVQGLGVLQDYVEAHKWLNLAASRGEAAALREREALAAKMTPEQIATAQERAVAWRPGASEAGDGPDTSVAQAPAAIPTLEVALTPDAGPPPPRVIREAQRLLGALGYRPGPADGIWGRRTGEAYRAFLRDAGLPAAEVLTPETLNAMRAVAKRRGSSTVEAASGAAVAPGAVQTPSQTRAVRPDALHRAAKAGDINGLKETIAAGADLNARDGRGWTALMHVVNKGYTLLVPLLLNAKAAVDIQAPDGATALFMAAVHGHTEIIALLVEAGADPSIKGPKGKTPVAVAQLHPEPAVRKAMKGHGVSDVFRDCPECPEMVVIPEGSFMMGSPQDEEGRNDSEGPVHRVLIEDRLAVGRYEVTFAQWNACHQDNGCTHFPSDEGWGRRNRPVINVSWEDAKAYVGWLSRKTGKTYRLLSESEWEYAARAGTETPFHYGRTLSTTRANYNGKITYGSGNKGISRGKTVPVGSFPPNGFGLHDMHGNVAEWVENCWREYYWVAPSDGNCARRVLRGGSWRNKPSALRSAFRTWNPSGFRSSLYGFRVARMLTVTPSLPAAAPLPAGQSTTTTGVDPFAEQQAYQSAFELVKLGRHDEAASAFRQFIVDYPTGSSYADNAQYWLGETLYITRRFELALQEFERLVSTYPTSQKLTSALLKIGYTHHELGNTREAEWVLGELIEQHPQSAEAGLARMWLVSIRQ